MPPWWPGSGSVISILVMTGNNLAMSDSLSEGFGRADVPAGLGVRPLPEANWRLEDILDASPDTGLGVLGIGGRTRTASYCAHPEVDLPFQWFRLAEADECLLALGGGTAPGFEALQVVPSGLQHYWRSDLMRTFDEQVPFVTRLCGRRSDQELVVEHITLPLVVEGSVSEIRGWFRFNQDLTSLTEWASATAAVAFDKVERFRTEQLSASPRDPENSSTPPQSLSGAPKEPNRAQLKSDIADSRENRLLQKLGKGGILSRLPMENMLQLAVGSLPPEVTQVLTKAANDAPDPEDPNALLMAFNHGPYGWLVVVPHPADVRDQNLPEMLAKIFRIGRAQGAGWIYLEPRADESHLALVRGQVPAD